MAWSARFEDPVPGLTSLHDAARYIERLPKAEQNLPHWQTAIEALIMTAEGRGPMLHARIAMLRAMHHGKPKPEKEPRRKRAKRYRIAG